MSEIKSSSTTNILEVEGLIKRYANHTALAGVSIEVKRGTILGLLGPNGAGKSTLIRSIMQIIALDEGEIRYDGHKLKGEDVRHFGYMPEERGLYKKMPVGEQILYLGQLKGMSRKEAESQARYWLERLGLQDWWKKSPADLSKGMQQKVQFITTVMHRPKLIILDEPFSGFDPVNANLVKDEILKLKDDGASIIFSTHRMESVEELCDAIALINKSKIVLNGETHEVRQRFRKDRFLIHYEVDGGREVELPLGFSLDKETYAPKGRRMIVFGTSPDPRPLIDAVFASGAKLLAFEEYLPSVNEIFIETVSETGGAMPKANKFASAEMTL